jgi:hypothetical protein
MKVPEFLLPCLFTLLTNFSATVILAQSEKFHQKDTSEIAGNWRGSSVCQIKNSACHDEIVVYNILKADADIYHVAMNKIVKGKIDFIAVVDFTYDEFTQTLSTNDNGRIWQFTMKKNSLDGILIWHAQLYRKLHLERE